MNSTVDAQMTGGQHLNEPHFDEEATIAARPVVPLEEVKAGNRSKAGTAVLLAIGGGLLFGLLAATLIYRYLGAGPAPAEETNTVVEQPVNQFPSATGGAAGIEESAVTTVQQEEAAGAAIETSDGQLESEESRPTGTQDRLPEVAPRRPVVVRESRPPVWDEDEQTARDIRRAERQEERRERRRAMRRQQRQSDQTADDLTRIREIFEGSPRP